MSLEFITDIPIEIDIKLFHLDLNYQKLSNEVLSQKQTRLSNTPINSSFEDTEFITPPNSESEKFLNTISEFFYTKNHRITEIWSHIHQPLESTNTHIHSGSLFNKSFVFYAKVPKNSGKLVFTLEKIYYKTIPPVNGNLLLFPSWLPHYVTKNLSNDIRISISGNVVPLE